jgi:hypothetical protein
MKKITIKQIIAELRKNNKIAWQEIVMQLSII